VIATIRRKAAATLISSGLVAGAFVAQAAPAGAATFTVRPGQSIQAAVDAAPRGSTINVLPGTYRESVGITKDGITLHGSGSGTTVLVPAAQPDGPCVFPSDQPGGPPDVAGICVVGNVDTSMFPTRVISPVRGVRVTGFTVKNFPGEGIFVIGGQGTTVQGNRLVNNGGYGVYANSSTTTSILANTASGSGEAGIYVGDSPDARAVIMGNTVFDNQFGVFIRSSSNGSISSNVARDNCLGILFLSEPDTDRNWVASSNQVNHNNKLCPGGEESPPLAGIGILVFNGQHITIQANTVNDNNPGANPSFVSGGIVLFAGSSGNIVVANNAHRNVPADLIDQSGASNRFSANNCDTSIPGGLCGHTVTTDPSTTTPPAG